MCRIGVVILNYQTWELSLRCMQSVRNACGRYAYRIYLVDNASERAMPQKVRKYLLQEGAQVRFLQAVQNRGYACGNNLGIAKALEDGCSVIVIANNDITFTENAIRNMADCLGRHQDAGIVGPKVLNGNGNVQISRCSMRTGIREIFQIYTAAKKICRRKWMAYYCMYRDPEKPAYVYHVSGCCFAISGECAKMVTPLDEGTVLYCEELILGLRMEQLGYRTIYEPGSVVVHRHGATAAGVRPFMYQCISQSELYYCGKYLKAGKWQLWVLYHYRRMLYRIRCLRSRELRRYQRTFMEETKKTYQKILVTVQRDI